MKKIVFLLIAVLLVGCKDGSNAVTYEKISPQDAKTLMVQGNIILDVRTAEEYADGHIDGAVLLPLADIQAGKYDVLDDKNQVILVYCRSGNRSGQASTILADAGYTNIKDFGGINTWEYGLVK